MCSNGVMDKPEASAKGVSSSLPPLALIFGRNPRRGPCSEIELTVGIWVPNGERVVLSLRLSSGAAGVAETGPPWKSG